MVFETGFQSQRSPLFAACNRFVMLVFGPYILNFEKSATAVIKGCVVRTETHTISYILLASYSVASKMGCHFCWWSLWGGLLGAGVCFCVCCCRQRNIWICVVSAVFLSIFVFVFYVYSYWWWWNSEDMLLPMCVVCDTCFVVLFPWYGFIMYIIYSKHSECAVLCCDFTSVLFWLNRSIESMLMNFSYYYFLF